MIRDVIKTLSILLQEFLAANTGNGEAKVQFIRQRLGLSPSDDEKGLGRVGVNVWVNEQRFAFLTPPITWDQMTEVAKLVNETIKKVA